MGYEARWNNSNEICACADTIEGAVGCVLSLTNGNGRVFIYEFGKDGKVAKEPIKVISIVN